MGYFSNRAEGMCYDNQYCANCVHAAKTEGEVCPVINVHYLYNYEQCQDSDMGRAIKWILNELIPISDEGPWNDECTMRYVEGSDG